MPWPFGEKRTTMKIRLLVMVSLLMVVSQAMANDLPSKLEASLQPVLPSSGKVGRFHLDKSVIILGVVQAVVNSSDVIQTRRRLSSGKYSEVDPFAKPFVHSDLVVATVTVIGVLGAAWLGQQMRYSRYKVFHKVWFLPQAVGIAGSAVGLTFSNLH